MKKLILLFFFALLLGCSHESINVQNYVESNFTTEFVDSFGAPDANHYWGFERSSTRAIDPNSNMWTWRPEDVTDNEIKEVDEWFKNHANPTSIEIDWSNFFVQHVIGHHGNMDQLWSTEHIYNFNANKGSIQKVVNGSSRHWQYHNSLDSKMHDEYVIVCIKGNYYIGFDFWATGQNPNQKENGDGIFNDWIVKITPAYNKMIIAEDLGVEDSDFDYNDVVFGIDGNVVTLLAAGGTLPLYIDGKEVHEKFGVPVTTMVNTVNFYEYPPVQFKIGNYTLQNIPIKVEGKAGMYTIPWFKGKPSAKICVDHGFIWSKERVPIQTTYPLFKEYVKDQTIKFW